MLVASSLKASSRQALKAGARAFQRLRAGLRLLLDRTVVLVELAAGLGIGVGPPGRPCVHEQFLIAGVLRMGGGLGDMEGANKHNPGK